MAMALLYNYTEASFYGINNMWLLFLIAAIDMPPAADQVPVAIPVVSMRERRRPRSIAVAPLTARADKNASIRPFMRRPAARLHTAGNGRPR